MATTRDATKIKDERVKQYFISDGFFEEGIETVDYKGYEIRIYNKERMLIELVRYKSKLPFDYYKEIILGYRKLVPSLDVISEKMEWSFRNSGMLFRNKRNEESFWSKARPFKSYSEASFC